MSAAERRFASQNDIEAAASTVAAVRSPHCGDGVCVAGGGEPVVDCRTDRAAPDRGIARPMMAGDEQHDALSAADRLLKAVVDGSPRGIEAHSVQIENAVRLD
jgi:hypothetical protein